MSELEDDTEIIEEESEDLDALDLTGGAGLPQVTYLQARRATRKYMKLLKTWPHPTFRVKCSKCGLACMVAESGKKAIDDALDAGEDLPVCCDECMAKIAPMGALEMTTEDQAEEINIVSRKLEAKDNRN